MAMMKNSIDTWSMIDKYGLKGCAAIDSDSVAVPDSEYQRLLDSAADKDHVQSLCRARFS